MPAPMACDDEDKEHGTKYEGNEHDSSRGDDESRLMLSNPGKVVVHAGQPLRLGVAAFGDDRHIVMGLSDLPKDALFVEAYNTYLRVQQGIIVWTPPADTGGKTVKFKFCAKAHGSGKPDVHSDSRKVSVKVLPKLTTVMNPDPAVATNVMSSAVYNLELQKLDVSGQVTWSGKSTIAERTATIVDPVKLSDAYDAVALGAAKVGLDGKWSVSIPLPRASRPRVIDATFQGRVATQLVKKLY
ncbi:hypothetical protein [Methyloglobulus sp.]|uniref:hypothetical protein n=1 Tax=Methyloglobulus sp. TaxID=2518622 RepID=UPI0032B7141B